MRNSSRPGMARVNERSHSFTCHPHVYPQVEWTIPAFTPLQPQSITALWLVLIFRPNEGRQLSWPGFINQATFICKCEVTGRWLCGNVNYTRTQFPWNSENVRCLCKQFGDVVGPMFLSAWGRDYLRFLTADLPNPAVAYRWALIASAPFWLLVQITTIL